MTKIISTTRGKLLGFCSCWLAILFLLMTDMASSRAVHHLILYYAYLQNDDITILIVILQEHSCYWCKSSGMCMERVLQICREAIRYSLRPLLVILSTATPDPFNYLGRLFEFSRRSLRIYSAQSAKHFEKVYLPDMWYVIKWVHLVVVTGSNTDRETTVH